MSDIYEIAKRLGIDKAGVDKTIERRGYPEALRTYKERLRIVEKQISERHERTLQQAEADRRRDIYESERAARDASREAARRQRTLGQRLDQTLAAIAALPTGPTVSLEPSVSTGKAEDHEPPPSQPLDVSPHTRIIEWHVEAIEHELDVARGVAKPSVWRTMGNAEKDKLIVERFAGVHVEDLARDCPELGSAGMIKRARRLAGVRTSDGLPRENGGLRAA